MSCDLTEKVSLLIDGELPPVESRAVERHLLECSECQQVRADFLSLRSRIDAYTPSLAPAPPRQKLARILVPPASTGRAGRPRSLGVLGWPRLTPALVTAVAILLIACALGAALRFRSLYRGVGAGAPDQDTVAKQQPKTSPASGPSPGPTVADSRSLNPAKSDEAVHSLEPKRRNRQRSDPASVVSQTNASARRPGRHEPSPQAPPEGSAAAEYVALNTMIADTASLAHIRSADTETLTAQHLEQSELLLRAFRNLRPGSPVGGDDLGYERRRAQQLFYQNVLLRREADTAGDVQVVTLLESLEPILLDIANLSDRAPGDDVRAIKERVERQNLVALLQINSTSPARANE